MTLRERILVAAKAHKARGTVIKHYPGRLTLNRSEAARSKYRAICEACSESTITNGHLKCAICGCGDPSKARPHCPTFKWGDDESYAEYMKEIHAADNTEVLVSVCINSKDEGLRLKRTCESFHKALADVKHEILVLADGCEAECYLGLDDVKVFINEDSVGCGRAKRYLLSKAVGRVIIFTDAHTEVISEALLRVIQKALRNKAIYTPLLMKIYYDEEWKPYVPGKAKFSTQPYGACIGRWGQYQVASADEKTKDTQVMMPSCTTIASRETWNAVGGWNNFLSLLGSQERGLAWRAFMSRIAIVQAHDLIVGHEFQAKSNPSRNKRPYNPNGKFAAACNMRHTFKTILSDKAYKQLFEKFIGEWSYDLYQEDEFAGEDQKNFKSLNKRTDEDFFNRLSELEGLLPVRSDDGGATLESKAVECIAARASGNALEFGTGSGKGTLALMRSNTTSVTSVDNNKHYLDGAHLFINFVEPDNKVEFVVDTINSATGFYSLDFINTELYNTILIDGPPGTRARKHAIDLLLSNLAPDGIILIDDTKRDYAQIDEACIRLGLTQELIDTNRGFRVIKRGTGKKDRRSGA